MDQIEGRPRRHPDREKLVVSQALPGPGCERGGRERQRPDPEEPASLADSVANAQAFAQRVFPLDFPPLGELVSLTAQTLAIVTLATLLSVRESLPVAVFAAWNTTTGAVARGSARTLIVVCRAVPDLILAIVFFRIFGLGALPGVLALGLHSVGMVGKLYADAIESLDNGPQEAIRAAGGGRTQQIVSGIIPPLMPQLIATAAPGPGETAIRIAASRKPSQSESSISVASTG